MTEAEEFAAPRTVDYPVSISVAAATEERNRLTSFFRFFLALPHIILVGGPVAVALAWDAGSENGLEISYGSAGLFGAVIAVVVVIAWFAILFTRHYPEGLRKLVVYYMRWRANALAYMTLLRDEYPPFGEGKYPVELTVDPEAEERNLVTVFFRILLAIPHLFLLGLLSVVWAVVTALAWLSILLTGSYPEGLYGFALGVFAWTVRVDAYVLLLTDEYPPFTLRA